MALGIPPGTMLLWDALSDAKPRAQGLIIYDNTLD